MFWTRTPKIVNSGSHDIKFICAGATSIIEKGAELLVYIVTFFFDCASRYTRVMKTLSMHYLSSVSFVNQPLHVSGIFVNHHQEV